MSSSLSTNSEGGQDRLKMPFDFAEDPAVMAAKALMSLQADTDRCTTTECSRSSRRSGHGSYTERLSYTETRTEQTLDSKVDETSHKAVSVCDESVEAG